MDPFSGSDEVLSLPPPRWAAQGASPPPPEVTITPPGSKSLTNRALLLAALASGASTLKRPLIDAEDARVMQAAIVALGCEVTHLAGGDLLIAGCGGRWKPRHPLTTLHLANAGTATRFLAAAVALLLPEGYTVELDGDPRMRQRPQAELLDALAQLPGVAPRITCTGAPGCLPLRISGSSGTIAIAIARPMVVRFGKTASSQFISAVLMLGPFLSGGITVEFADAITSEPYVDMTVGLLDHLRARIDDQRRGTEPRLQVSGQSSKGAGLDPFTLTVEPDASGASSFLVAGALRAGGLLRITGLGSGLGPRGQSLQGDAAFVEVLAAAGVRWHHDGGDVLVEPASPIRPLRSFDVDLSGMPDTAMAAAVLAACVAPGPNATSRLRGLQTLRHKETDRICALQNELGRLGVQTQVAQDEDREDLIIQPTADLSPRGGLVGEDLAAPLSHAPVTFDTYRDHRMAMTMALFSLVRPGISIRDPKCVGKTYPGYWDDFAKLSSLMITDGSRVSPRDRSVAR